MFQSLLNGRSPSTLVGTTVRVRGVGFYDLAHGQRGRSRNIELIRPCRVVGKYDFVFVNGAQRRDVRIVLSPKGSNPTGTQIVIDTPTSQQDVGQPSFL